jgi:hypothetical protein
MRFFRSLIVSSVLVFGLLGAARASIVVDTTDGVFARQVNDELALMRSGQRGVVCKNLVDRLDAATSTTTIRLLGADESTWHPNDHRGTRSWVAPQDTRIRGAERKRPTNAILYLHPTRIDPSLSLFKLGTFVHELSFAADLNEGKFAADFRVREKRASFYRNAWLDALHLRPVLVSDRVATGDYGRAKEQGLITADHAADFPILSADATGQALIEPSPAR